MLGYFEKRAIALIRKAFVNAEPVRSTEEDERMRQLLYVSTKAQPALGSAIRDILAQSRRNNAAVNVTGLLWTDETRFLQVLEGERAAVQEVFDRISVDPRHKAIVVLHDRGRTARTFGDWSMAYLDDSDARIAAALSGADPEVRGTFEGFIAARRAA